MLKMIIISLCFKSISFLAGNIVIIWTSRVASTALITVCPSLVVIFHDNHTNCYLVWLKTCRGGWSNKYECLGGWGLGDTFLLPLLYNIYAPSSLSININQSVLCFSCIQHSWCTEFAAADDPEPTADAEHAAGPLYAGHDAESHS